MHFDDQDIFFLSVSNELSVNIYNRHWKKNNTLNTFIL